MYITYGHYKYLVYGHMAYRFIIVVRLSKTFGCISGISRHMHGYINVPYMFLKTLEWIQVYPSIQSS